MYYTQYNKRSNTNEHTNKFGSYVRDRFSDIDDAQRKAVYSTERPHKRVSNQRACIGVALARNGVKPEVIAKVMDDAYALNNECKAKELNPYDILLAETGLYVI